MGACLSRGARRMQFCVTFIAGGTLLCSVCGHTVVAFFFMISSCSLLLLINSDEMQETFPLWKEVLIWCFAVGVGYGGHVNWEHKDMVGFKALCETLVDKHTGGIAAFLCVLSCVFLSVQEFMISLKSRPKSPR